jgi:hypothetical protein
MANDGDTVLISIGTYYENINSNRNKIAVGSLYLTTNDKSYISKTVINGGLNEEVVIFDNVDSTAILSGLTVTNGVGGISCNGSNPTLSNLRIIGNHGSGLWLKSSNPNLIALTISENIARLGGGIYIAGGWRVPDSNPKFDSVNRCNIYNNHGSIGGDIYNNRENRIDVIVDTFTVANPTNFHTFPASSFNFDIINAKIVQVNDDLYVNPNGDNNNSGLFPEEPFKTVKYAYLKIIADSLNPHTIHLANGEYTENEPYTIGCVDYVSILGESKTNVIFSLPHHGGEIFSFNSTKGVSLENLTILGDSTHTLGISCANSNPVIKNVTLNGAYIELRGSNPHIENVKISGNMGSCGMWLMHGSNPTLVKVEITKNIGWPVGGLCCTDGSQANLINCTISGNQSIDEDIGGIHIESGSTLNIINSIIWGNPSKEIGVNSGSILATNSLFEGGSSGILILGGENHLYWLDGNIDADPMFVDTANGDYRLLEGSSCMDAGLQDAMIVYNNGQDTLIVPPMDYIGLAPDMGAHEYDPTSSASQRVYTPNVYSLYQNYPNPYNPSTTIEKVSNLLSKKLNQGNHTYTFDGKNLASGIYYYQLTAGDYSEVKKMILLK